MSHTMTASPKPSFGNLGGWATPCLAEEILDGQHQRVDISTYAKTAHRGLLQKEWSPPWQPNWSRDWTDSSGSLAEETLASASTIPFSGEVWMSVHGNASVNDWPIPGSFSGQLIGIIVSFSFFFCSWWWQSDGNCPVCLHTSGHCGCGDWHSCVRLQET